MILRTIIILIFNPALIKLHQRLMGGQTKRSLIGLAFIIPFGFIKKYL